MKIEYEFDEPDFVLEYESTAPFSKVIPDMTEITFKEFLESDKRLFFIL